MFSTCSHPGWQDGTNYATLTVLSRTILVHLYQAFPYQACSLGPTVSSLTIAVHLYHAFPYQAYPLGPTVPSLTISVHLYQAFPYQAYSLGPTVPSLTVSGLLYRPAISSLIQQILLYQGMSGLLNKAFHTRPLPPTPSPYQAYYTGTYHTRLTIPGNLYQMLQRVFLCQA